MPNMLQFTKFCFDILFLWEYSHFKMLCFKFDYTYIVIMKATKLIDYDLNELSFDRSNIPL